MRLIDCGYKGNVYQTLPSLDLVADFWSDILSLIVMRGGVIERNVPSCGGSRYIRAIIGGSVLGGVSDRVVLRIRIANHTRRTQTLNIQPVRRTVDGYKCEVLSYSSFARVKSLIQSL